RHHPAKPPHHCDPLSQSSYRERIDLTFSNATARPHTYTLSLHDALPISLRLADDEQLRRPGDRRRLAVGTRSLGELRLCDEDRRSEEHTSELQSLTNLVCRLLLEKKKNRCATTRR